MTDTIEQGSDEWFAIRLGKVTASKIADVMSTGRGNAPSATRANYMAQLVTERLTGVPYPSFKSDAMEWGNETEAQARDTYAMMQGVDVSLASFVPHPEIAMCGASPDAYADIDGLCEIKCPHTKTHLETLDGAPIDRRYLLQMHWQMACTERAWCDFVSFDPRLPASMQLHVQRVERDDGEIEKIEGAVLAFLADLDRRVAGYSDRYFETQEAA